MKKRSFAILVVISWLYLTLGTPLHAAQPTGSQTQGFGHPTRTWFFQMHTHSLTPWPAVPFSGLRMWGTGTTWSTLNPSPGVYDWTRLDQWLTGTQKQGNYSFIMTLAMTPTWASSNPTDQNCRYAPGACDAPNDLNPDGTGTDQHWKDFVTAIASHSAGRIKMWEIWNEPVNYYYWSGTPQQMVRMAADARQIILQIDPTARMLTPPNGSTHSYGMKWWQQYAAAGGLKYADVIAMHGYVTPTQKLCGNYPQASDFVTAMQNLKTLLAQYGMQNYPIWDTEASWGPASQLCFTDPDLQAAFLAQFYMLHRSEGVRRFYWFAYDDQDAGEMYDLKTKQLTKAGLAYQQLYTWMMGNSLTQACSSVGTVWTCNLAGSGGYVAEAVWDTAESCNNGTCQTIEYGVDSKFKSYRTLDGQTLPVNNNHVPIGAKPILLQNR